MNRMPCDAHPGVGAAREWASVVADMGDRLPLKARHYLDTIGGLNGEAPTGVTEAATEAAPDDVQMTDAAPDDVQMTEVTA